jgi:prepilin-type N-terminal cleavage/methylation domain-containing protein
MSIINKYMRNYLKLFKRDSGFTLIELLVVIGILGVLAAALVATIDPFEQLNKAQDSSTKNTVVEYIDANIRYFTTHSAMPWADAALNGACQTAGAPTGVGLQVASMIDCTKDLMADSELKPSFSTATNILKNIYVTAGADNVVIACYLPVSKSQKRDPLTTKTLVGGDVANPTTNCKGYGGGTDCYWCTQ